jgi:segregation and condensation protein A
MTSEPLPSAQPGFRIELPVFEGPLDLLLHLIQTHELEILDLPIAFVTEKYLEYLGLMKKLDLDVASDYLVMAATLAHIKSKMLLPEVPADQNEEGAEEIDPRAELIRRLLEYQKYKKVAEELGGRGLAGRDVFVRRVDEADDGSLGTRPLAEISLFKLIDAFQAVLARVRGNLAFEVTRERISIQERSTELIELLTAQNRCSFDDLFTGARSVYDVVVTFLALLELARRQLLSVYQAGPGTAIYVEHRIIPADAAMTDPGELDDSTPQTEARAHERGNGYDTN